MSLQVAPVSSLGFALASLRSLQVLPGLCDGEWSGWRLKAVKGTKAIL